MVREVVRIDPLEDHVVKLTLDFDFGLESPESIPSGGNGIYQLGDGDFSGVVNSQFQSETYGMSLELGFELDSDTYDSLTRLEFSMYCKGVQAQHPIKVNDVTIGDIPDSPTDGSFGLVAHDIPLNALQSDYNLIRF